MSLINQNVPICLNAITRFQAQTSETFNVHKKEINTFILFRQKRWIEQKITLEVLFLIDRLLKELIWNSRGKFGLAPEPSLHARKQRYLSHDDASESDITPCNKIDKPLVVYRFTGNVMTSIITLRKIRETCDAFTPKMYF